MGEASSGQGSITTILDLSVPKNRNRKRNRCVFKSQIQNRNSRCRFRRKIAEKTRNEIANRRILKSQIPNRNGFCLWNSRDKSKVPKLSDIENRCDFLGVQFATIPHFWNRSVFGMLRTWPFHLVGDSWLILRRVRECPPSFLSPLSRLPCHPLILSISLFLSPSVSATLLLSVSQSPGRSVLIVMSFFASFFLNLVLFLFLYPRLSIFPSLMLFLLSISLWHILPSISDTHTHTDNGWVTVQVPQLA